MFQPNAITNTDFYKIGHPFQYPEGTTTVYSNLTARSDKYTICNDSPYYDNKVVFFGLQYFIKHYLIDYFNESFFNLPLEQVLKSYKRRMDTSLGKDSVPTDHIEALHKLGYLPILIKALPEGSRVDLRVPFLTMKNTLPEFYWVTNFLETTLSCILWKLCNNATIAYEYKRLLTKFAETTGVDLGFVQFQGHDFSFRGMSGVEDAMASGMAHLTCFAGTDTISAIDGVEHYYNSNCEEELIGCSVPATEHSVSCSQIAYIQKSLEQHGEYNGDKLLDFDSEDLDWDVEDFKLIAELLFIKELLTKKYPKGYVSVVADTFDFWSVITIIAKELKPIIEARDGKVVFRPDSGNPVDILCGLNSKKIEDFYDKYGNYNFYTDLTDHDIEDFDLGCDLIEVKGQYYTYKAHVREVDGYGACNNINLLEKIEISPRKGAVECLWDIYGGTINEKGYKVLNPKVGLIYGDSITIDVARQICERLEVKGFASTNVVFGIGSYTYQYSTRDSFGMAVKSTYVEINGECINIEKNPKTGDGIKKSAKGLLQVCKNGHCFTLKDSCTAEEELAGELRDVFKDGVSLNEQTLAEIRARLTV